MTTDYSKLFPLNVPDGTIPEDFSGHIEAVFGILRKFGLRVEVDTTEDDRGLEIKVTDAINVTTKFEVYPRPEITYPYELPAEEVNSLEEFLGWLWDHYDDFIEGPTMEVEERTIKIGNTSTIHF